MNTRERQTVDYRLGRIERSLRIVFLMGASLAMLLLIGAYTSGNPEVIRAERFELVDAAGLVRATLKINEDGETGLFVMDDSSRIRISVTHASDQTALLIKDAAGDTRVGAAQFSHGGGGFALHGEEMKGAAVLYLQNHQGSLRVFDAEGQVMYMVPSP